MKFTRPQFDYSKLTDEVKTELETFFTHYNNTIVELQQVLKSINITDNFAGSLTTQLINSGQDVSISNVASYASVVASNASVESFKMIKTQEGLIVNVVFAGGVKTSSVTFLTINK